MVLVPRAAAGWAGVADPLPSRVDTELAIAADLRRIGDEFSLQDSGTLSIATTHTQARYMLPGPVALPSVSLLATSPTSPIALTGVPRPTSTPDTAQVDPAPATPSFIARVRNGRPPS